MTGATEQACGLPGLWPELEGLTIAPGSVAAPSGARAFWEPGPGGARGLSHSEGGRTRRLTSAVDPRAEDQALTARLALKADEGVLCLGLGLGYHLEELAGRLAPETPLWVMESRPELAAAAFLARDLRFLLPRPGFRLFIGPFKGAAPWAAGDRRPPQTLIRPSVARFFAHEYPALGPEAGPSRPRPAGRRRLERTLICQSGYFLDREIMNASRAIGLETAAWNFKRELTGSDKNFQTFLGLIKSFRPDLVLTVNHLGFDGQGILDDVFSRLKLPAASWFVDSPAFILKDRPPAPSPFVSVFSWDRDYLPFLKSQGFEKAHYLPLAADENFFRPAARPAAPSRRIAFVGDTLTAATEKYLEKLGLERGALAETDKAALSFLERPGLWPEPEALSGLAAILGLAETPGRLADLAGLVTWRASRLYRLKILKALPASELAVAGDENWRGLLNIPAGAVGPPLDYYTELCPYYQGSAVNLNITSAQMKTGLNQRVFDVPAAGGFLLTDRRAQLEELFEPGLEAVAYDGPEEAAELAAWYAKRREPRERVARAARRKVLARHLYRFRLAELVETVRRGL
ncbi:MAG: glycosyltransferase [Candidatus Adiutrix sp.]|jgi:spore maturation protein CgeB|nr:glycosyltransferase [Candidatus Adiutrix sp.]